jgi:hypothetical protein
MPTDPSPYAGELEDRIGPATDFMLNRLDNVAEWVIGWMPPEDNAQHHNAVEHLMRLRQTNIWIARAVNPNYRPSRISETVVLYLPDADPGDIAVRQRVRDLTRKYRDARSH